MGTLGQAAQLQFIRPETVGRRRAVHIFANDYLSGRDDQELDGGLRHHSPPPDTILPNSLDAPPAGRFCRGQAPAQGCIAIQVRLLKSGATS